MNAVQAYVLAYPIVLPLAFLATWLAGRLSLGYWPRPSLDDPKHIGAWVDVPYNITALLMVVGLPAFAFGIISLIYRGYCDETRRRSLLLVSTLSVICMVATVLILRLDPWGIVTWYAD
jgi:hypothetical protein